MKSRVIETILGGVVILTAVFVLAFVYRFLSADSSLQRYKIGAVFSDVGGLENGADVRLNGITIGTVDERSLAPETYEAVVILAIHDNVILPSDSRASIGSEGVTGGKYVMIEPGRASGRLTPGSRITRTEPYRSIETQISRIIFLATRRDES